jgi:enediyne biosynthesis protein E8
MKKSETDRIIQREVGRLPRTAGTSFRLTRRALLKSVATLAAAWTINPWRIVVPSAFGQEMEDPATIATLEAYADTLIPGEKRFPGDRAIAGVVSGAGAVQGGALDMMNFVGFGPVLFFIGEAINSYAVLYALLNGIVLDPTVPPFVSLDFASRTALVVAILGGSGADQPVFSGLAALSFVAFNTAGYLTTVDAIQQGHPGLAAIGFPAPNPDGKWRFPDFSYQRVLAKPHPRSKRDNPA